jgi:hypothetical protein
MPSSSFRTRTTVRGVESAGTDLPYGTEQTNEGIQLAVCVDPDGLAISFAEPLPREATGPA